MPFDPVGYVETKPDVLGGVFLRAAEIIEQRGWLQGAYGSALDGPVCATKAVWLALAEGGFAPSYMDFQNRLGFRGEGADILSFWNDHPGRTKADVLARLRAGARPS